MKNGVENPKVVIKSIPLLPNSKSDPRKTLLQSKEPLKIPSKPSELPVNNNPKGPVKDNKVLGTVEQKLKNDISKPEPKQMLKAKIIEQPKVGPKGSQPPTTLLKDPTAKLNPEKPTGAPVTKLKQNLLQNLKEKPRSQVKEVMQKEVRNNRLEQGIKEHNEKPVVLQDMGFNRSSLDDQILLNTDEYHIQWEIGPFKRDLIRKGFGGLLQQYMDIFKRSDGVLKQYIRIKKGLKFTLNEVPDHKILRSLKKNVSFPQCHLVIIVGMVELTDGTIAQARLIKDDEQEKTARVGYLEINFNELYKDYSSFSQ